MKAQVKKPAPEMRSAVDKSTVTVMATGKRLDVDENPLCHTHTTGVLTFLDPPLRLRQPTPVTIHYWTDGVVEAHLADALLIGEGDDEAEALDNLRENIADAWNHLQHAAAKAKPARRMWRALSAICTEDPSA